VCCSGREGVMIRHYSLSATATHCITMQHKQQDTLQHTCRMSSISILYSRQYLLSCNTLQHATTQCNTKIGNNAVVLPCSCPDSFTATHCISLQHTHCNAHCNTLVGSVQSIYHVLVLTHLLQHTATHTATHSATHRCEVCNQFTVSLS